MAVDWSNYPETFWHCYVRLQGPKYRGPDGIVNDLTIQQIRQQVVEPWHQRRPFNISGIVVRRLEEVAEIAMAQTPEPQRYYADRHDAEMRRKNVADLATDRRLLPFRPGNGTDYTNELLFGESSPATGAPTEVTPGEPSVPSAAKAFTVHGHDTAILNEVARFVEHLDIEAIILMEQEHKGRTLIEKLEQNTDVPYAIILCTPDDLGRAKDETELKPRARQNVILELGYLIGEIGRDRICVLKTEDVDMPSDLHGVGYHDIDSKGAWKLLLAKEMKAAGLPVDLNKVL